MSELNSPTTPTAASPGAPLPDNETARLRALRSYGVLDSVAEEALSAIVRVAASVCEAPIALVSLIDERRQWFLASAGLDGGVTETPRELAFCAHAIHDTHVMVVEDATRDARFAENPLVTGEPHIRFYAGAPLVDQKGFALGTLCVVGARPRKLTAFQAKVLQELSSVVVRLLEARKADLALHDALLASEQSNDMLMLAEEVADVGHWRIDADDHRIFWSPQVFRIHGRDPSTFVPTLASGIEAFHPDDRARVSEHVHKALETGADFEFELRLVRPDGSIRRVESRGRCEIDPTTGKPKAVVGVFQDCTERHALRERLARQERLVTTGTLAAGVGHEINNPLTYVVANIGFAIDGVKRLEGCAPRAETDDVLGVLEDAREGAHRIGKIVLGLKAFAREDVLAPTDLHAAIEMSKNMAAYALRTSAELVTELGEVPFVMADSSRLSQVFVNLFLNSAQAFVGTDPSRNRITVRTRLLPDGRVSVEVEDNGPGIPDDVLPRIFDPFFTTKEVGHGTGLGLAICHDIVESFGGEISCTTRLGEGTSFRIVLARAPADARLAPSVMEPAPAAIRGRILVIDDEPAILRTFERALRAEHDVVLIGDSREAQRLLLGAHEPFDVIFCDLMMPHLNGMDLYREVEGHDPAVAERFAFVTGGVLDARVQSFLEDVPNPRFEKPFTSARLRGMTSRLVSRIERRGRTR
jgi:PAS domain S-box-containing protein